MVEVIPNQQLGEWNQTNNSDIMGTVYGNLNMIYAGAGLDTSENIGRLRVGKRILLNSNTIDLSSINSYPIGFKAIGSSIYTACGLSNIGYALYNSGLPNSAPFSVDKTSNITYAYTTGSNLNDLTVPSPSAGTFGLNHVYLITISNTGTPDQFNWTVDGNAGGTNVNITGASQTLSNGVAIKFNATTGHTLSNQWTVTLSCAPSTVDSTTSDMCLSNNALWVTSSDLVKNTVMASYKVGNTAWGFINTGVTPGNYANMLCSYATRTYMTNNQSQIISWGSNNVAASQGAQYTITLNVPADFTTVITKIVPASDRIWIFTVNTTGGKGKIYEWDGSSASPTKVYNLSSSGALFGIVKDDVPYALDTNGNWLKWNGGAFITVDGLNRPHNKLLYNPLSLVNNRFIHPNGGDIIKDKINLFIDGRNYDSTSSLETTIPTGIYEYDEKRGIINKHTISTNRPTDTINDYGQLRIAQAGALAEINIPSNSATRNGTFMVGATYYLNATATASGIFYDDSNDTYQKGAYLITPKIQSQNVTDAWQLVFPRIKLLTATGDKMVIKYRTSELDPTEILVTWISSNSFTTTNTAITGYAIGDEVMGTQGLASMVCSHITAISPPNGGVYTVAVDESCVGELTTAYVLLSHWVKMSVKGNDTFITGSPNFQSIGLPATLSTTWIQFKLYMIFTGKKELEEIDIQSHPSTTANK